MGWLLDLIYPKKCVGCNKNGKYLCGNCEKTLKINQLSKNKLGLFRYDGVIRKLIGLIKFELVTEAIAETTDLMTKYLKSDFPNLVSYWQEKKMTLMPVPLHWRRENWRGFNQSSEIGRILAKQLKIKFDDSIVVRTKMRKIQSLLVSKKDKKENVSGIFKIKGILPKNIIIFDDVYTSGETSNEIKRLIPKQNEVWILTIASGG